jgi:hypothetical protein
LSSHPKSQLISYCLFGMATGLVLIVLPEFVRRHPASLYALSNGIMKHLSWLELWLLLGGGFIWGLLVKRPYSSAAALCQPVILPMLAVVEMMKDPTSHNLWPFEFAIYVFMGGVGFAGSLVAGAVKKAVS